MNSTIKQLAVELGVNLVYFYPHLPARMGGHWRHGTKVVGDNDQAFDYLSDIETKQRNQRRRLNDI